MKKIVILGCENSHATKFLSFLTTEERFADSITLADGYECKPAGLICDPDRLGGIITLTEGKYHQIKRMFAALGMEVTALRRISMGGVWLDPALGDGECRELTPEELELIEYRGELFDK